VKGADACSAAALRLLFEYAIYIQPINHPTVPEGEECLRVIISYKHREEHIRYLVSALRDVLSHPLQVKQTMA
jgi:5-aminolevulinate synthase